MNKIKNIKNLATEEKDDQEFRMIMAIKTTKGSQIRGFNKLAQSNYNDIDYQLLAERYYETLGLIGWN